MHLQRGLDRRDLAPELLRLFVSSLLFAQVRQPFGDIRAVPDISDREPETVVMQATGVYWIALFQILESYGFQVNVVNARHTKTLPGRKTDVLECQWLQKLHTFGLLNNSFRPPEEIQILRTYLRQRENLVTAASTCIQHMQKTLTQMNVQLANVISDISGVTGMAILRAIVAGERDTGEISRLQT